MPVEKKVVTDPSSNDPTKSSGSPEGQSSQASEALTAAATSTATSATQIVEAAKPLPPVKLAPPAPPVFKLPEIETKEYFDNPVESTAKVVGAMVAPLIHNYGEGAIAQQKATLQASAGDDYNTYSGEIDGMLNSLSSEQRAIPDIVKRTYDFVRGQHVGDIVEKEREGMDARVAEEVKKRMSSLPGGGAGPSSANADSKLTAEQREACRNLRVSEEDYLKGVELGEE